MTANDMGELLATVPAQMYIDGSWIDASTGATFDVIDPATGGVIRTIADASAPDGLRALDAAVTNAEAWAATPPRQRAEILRRAYDLLCQRRDDFALLMTLEIGKPLAEARGEVDYGAEFLRWFSEEAVRVAGRYGSNPEGTGRIVVTQHPVGPCYLIAPWNFRLAMATRKVVPALAAGCTMIVKPAEHTPLTTLAFAALLDEAGLPAGVVNVVTTSRPADLSAPIIADPRLRKLSFTGSTPVGRRLLELAADGVLRASMELGGNAPFIVFDDADLDQAIAGAMAAKFRNIGQACTAANRFIVHRAVADEFAQRVVESVNALRVGRGTDDGVTIGPLVNESAVDNVDALVQDALRRGGTLAIGGNRQPGPGTFYQPTVLTGIAPGSRILREEIFGPVLAIMPFDNEDEAVRLANDTEYGPRVLRFHSRSGPRAAHDRAAANGDDGTERRGRVQCGRAVRWLATVRYGP